ncbi:LytR/AlgR family response regulator transcription factor [candidate division KSB1 bacterium]
MRILVVEDEPYAAEYIVDKCHSILGSSIRRINHENSLEKALDHIASHPIDLLFLDLNLSGENGYDILKNVISKSFHTIIISAYPEQAIEAFQYGVLDFIPKPFTEKRLMSAFEKYFDLHVRRDILTKYLSVKVAGTIKLIHLDKIMYFKASGNYVEIHLTNKQKELLDKKMCNLEIILPANFIRIHRSVIVDISQITSYIRKSSGAYQVELKDHTVLPLGKKHLKTFREIITANN